MKQVQEFIERNRHERETRNGLASLHSFERTSWCWYKCWFRTEQTWVLLTTQWPASLCSWNGVDGGCWFRTVQTWMLATIIATASQSSSIWTFDVAKMLLQNGVTWMLSTNTMGLRFIVQLVWTLILQRWFRTADVNAVDESKRHLLQLLRTCWCCKSVDSERYGSECCRQRQSDCA